ncbi:acyl carrier protein [Frankia sp. QA3]|uniref:acyl carrier protein n=1 Tax=Frankia sp. QA3 TaxID=710111 RepID=UPI000269C650|nr:acyl carrier protein [Frankia sp. QA3]EIV93553.1 acyl carrier protein [Frankia sp. QA3]
MNITIDEIRLILIASAGAPEVEVAENDFADTSFDDLGYESLALLESAATIERDYGVRIPDEPLIAAKTPRELAAIVQAAQAATQS